MPDQTPNLQLPVPLGNENVNRQFFIDLINAIDVGAVSDEQLAQAISEIAIAMIDEFNSTDKTKAPTADALRRGLETKQNILRLADNYLAASVLVNATPDTNGRAYPDGVSMFKVSSSVGGWPAANGYVLTFRAGSGGYQIFYEMYTGNVQTDKTARQWTRSKRDSNAFWQDWARGLTEVDLDAHIADYVRQPGYAATAGTGAAYTAALSPQPAALVDGLAITIVPHAANTVADPTLKIGTLGALPIRRQSGGTFAAGAIKAGQPLSLIKVGSYFLARSAGATGNATPAQVRSGSTFSNETDVDQVGTLPVRATSQLQVTSNQTLAGGIYDNGIEIDIPFTKRYYSASVPDNSFVTFPFIPQVVKLGTASSVANGSINSRTPNGSVSRFVAGSPILVFSSNPGGTGVPTLQNGYAYSGFGTSITIEAWE